MVGNVLSDGTCREAYTSNKTTHFIGEAAHVRDLSNGQAPSNGQQENVLVKVIESLQQGQNRKFDRDQSADD